MLERRKSLDVPPERRRVRSRIAFRRKTDDLSAILPRLNKWWDAFCRQHGTEPRSPLCEEFGYHVVELVKNGAMAADRVEVSAVVRRGFLGAVIVDDGPGIGDLDFALRSSMGQGHGLQSAIDFADWIAIRSSGWAFEKAGKGQRKRVARTNRGTRIEIAKQRQEPENPAANRSRGKRPGARQRRARS